MPRVTRIVRDSAGEVGTADGYIYRWAAAGDAIDVLPQHREDLLALPGYSKVRVTVVDEPVVLPHLTERDATPDTRVEPPETRTPAAPAPRVTDGWSDLDVVRLAHDRGLIDLDQLRAELGQQ